MITVIVNFTVPTGTTVADFKSQMEPTIPQYQAVPGLLRKLYLYNEEQHLVAGVYTFASRNEADACFSPDWFALVTNLYSKPTLTYYETLIVIDNERSAVVA